MNTIILDKSDPEIAKAVAGCEVGKPQTFTIEATPVSDSDTLLVATIDSIEYEEPDGAAPVEEDMAGESPETEVPYKPKPKKGSATAVEDMA
jgi:hypothetical protein